MTLAVAVDGTDLATIGKIVEAEGMFGLPGYRGSNLTIPTRPGDRHVSKLAGVQTRDLMLLIEGTGADPFASMASKLRDLRRLLFKPERALSLQRTVDYADGQVVATAAAQAMPFDPVIDAWFARCPVAWQILEGGFYGVQQSQVLASGGNVTVDNLGDDRTRKVTLAFTGGAGPYVLTNTTTGRALTVSVGGAVNVDVWAATATGPGGSVLASLVTSGDVDERFWMTLVPGNNTLTLTGGGSVTVSWQPVYL